MDGAGRSKFTVDIRIAAVEAFFAHIDIVFHASITGFPIGMIYAVSQLNSLL
jgi:hypothetical protein